MISLLKSNFSSEDFNTMLLLDVVNYGSFFTDSFSLSVNCHNFLGKLVEWFSIDFSTILNSVCLLLNWLPPKAKKNSSLPCYLPHSWEDGFATQRHLCESVFNIISCNLNSTHLFQFPTLLTHLTKMIQSILL